MEPSRALCLRTLKSTHVVLLETQVAQRKEDDTWVMARVTEQHTALVLKQVCR